jgi:L-threonylcarbamoyladenylate synthase
VKTQIIKINPESPEMDRIAHCAGIIRQGGLIIFPTETVYGIAADFNNPKAMARLREVKRRDGDKPFSIHIPQKGLLPNYTPVKSPEVYKMIDACWPGPLTVVVPSFEDGGTIGVRIPNHKIALSLVQESQCTIAAPSANFAGNPPPATCMEALKDLDGLVDIAIDGGEAKFGLASSVVDFTQEKPVVLRQGPITQEDVDRITQKKLVLFVCTGNSCRSVMAEYLLKSMLKGKTNVEVLSAGTAVYFQTTASSETIMVLGRHGIDATRHESRPIGSILLRKADIILVMTRSHRQQVLERVPSVEKRVYQLREFLQERPGYDGDLDIPDPMGKSFETYEECALMIKTAVTKLVNLL